MKISKKGQFERFINFKGSPRKQVLRAEAPNKSWPATQLSKNEKHACNKNYFGGNICVLYKLEIGTNHCDILILTNCILSSRHFVQDILSTTYCPRHFVRDVLSATFCPRHFVRDILSNDILSSRHFVRDILSTTFCPRHFVQ